MKRRRPWFARQMNNSSAGPTTVPDSEQMIISPKSTPGNSTSHRLDRACTCIHCRYMTPNRKQTFTPSSIRSPDPSMTELFNGKSFSLSPELSQKDLYTDSLDLGSSAQCKSPATMWAWDSRYVARQRTETPWLPSGSLSNLYVKKYTCCRCGKRKRRLKSPDILPCCKDVLRKRFHKNYIYLPSDEPRQEEQWPFVPNENLALNEEADDFFMRCQLGQRMQWLNIEDGHAEGGKARSVDMEVDVSFYPRRKMDRKEIMGMSSPSQAAQSKQMPSKGVTAHPLGYRLDKPPRTKVKTDCSPKTLILPILAPPVGPAISQLPHVFRRRCHQRVLAFNDADGIFYPGSVRKCVAPERSIIRFRHNGNLSEIPNQLTLPTMDMLPTQPINDGDTVLVRVKNVNSSCECWIPARVIGGFLGSPDPRYPLRHRYQIRLFTGAQHVFRRRDILRISPIFYQNLVDYIRLKRGAEVSEQKVTSGRAESEVRAKSRKRPAPPEKKTTPPAVLRKPRAPPKSAQAKSAQKVELTPATNEVVKPKIAPQIRPEKKTVKSAPAPPPPVAKTQPTAKAPISAPKPVKPVVRPAPAPVPAPTKAPATPAVVKPAVPKIPAQEALAATPKVTEPQLPAPGKTKQKKQQSTKSKKKDKPLTTGALPHSMKIKASRSKEDNKEEIERPLEDSVALASRARKEDDLVDGQLTSDRSVSKKPSSHLPSESTVSQTPALQQGLNLPNIASEAEDRSHSQPVELVDSPSNEDKYIDNERRKVSSTDTKGRMTKGLSSNEQDTAKYTSEDVLNSDKPPATMEHSEPKPASSVASVTGGRDRKADAAENQIDGKIQSTDKSQQQKDQTDMSEAQPPRISDDNEPIIEPGFDVQYPEASKEEHVKTETRSDQDPVKHATEDVSNLKEDSNDLGRIHFEQTTDKAACSLQPIGATETEGTSPQPITETTEVVRDQTIKSEESKDLPVREKVTISELPSQTRLDDDQRTDVISSKPTSKAAVAVMEHAREIESRELRGATDVLGEERTIYDGNLPPQKQPGSKSDQTTPGESFDRQYSPSSLSKKAGPEGPVQRIEETEEGQVTTEEHSKLADVAAYEKPRSGASAESNPPSIQDAMLSGAIAGPKAMPEAESTTPRIESTKDLLKQVHDAQITESVEPEQQTAEPTSNGAISGLIAPTDVVSDQVGLLADVPRSGASDIHQVQKEAFVKQIQDADVQDAILDEGPPVGPIDDIQEKTAKYTEEKERETSLTLTITVKQEPEEGALARLESQASRMLDNPMEVVVELKVSQAFKSELGVGVPEKVSYKTDLVKQLHDADQGELREVESTFETTPGIPVTGVSPLTQSDAKDGMSIGNTEVSKVSSREKFQPKDGWVQQIRDELPGELSMGASSIHLLQSHSSELPAIETEELRIDTPAATFITDEGGAVTEGLVQSEIGTEKSQHSSPHVHPHQTDEGLDESQKSTLKIELAIGETLAPVDTEKDIVATSPDMAKLSAIRIHSPNEMAIFSSEESHGEPVGMTTAPESHETEAYCTMNLRIEVPATPHQIPTTKIDLTMDCKEATALNQIDQGNEHVATPTGGMSTASLKLDVEWNETGPEEEQEGLVVATKKKVTLGASHRPEETGRQEPPVDIIFQASVTDPCQNFEKEQKLQIVAQIDGTKSLVDVQVGVQAAEQCLLTNTQSIPTASSYLMGATNQVKMVTAEPSELNGMDHDLKPTGSQPTSPTEARQSSSIPDMPPDITDGSQLTASSVPKVDAILRETELNELPSNLDLTQPQMIYRVKQEIVPQHPSNLLHVSQVLPNQLTPSKQHEPLIDPSNQEITQITPVTVEIRPRHSGDDAFFETSQQMGTKVSSITVDIQPKGSEEERAGTQSPKQATVRQSTADSTAVSTLPERTGIDDDRMVSDSYKISQMQDPNHEKPSSLKATTGSQKDLGPVAAISGQKDNIPSLERRGDSDHLNLAVSVNYLDEGELEVITTLTVNEKKHDNPASKGPNFTAHVDGHQSPRSVSPKTISSNSREDPTFAPKSATLNITTYARFDLSDEDLPSCFKTRSDCNPIPSNLMNVKVNNTEQKWSGQRSELQSKDIEIELEHEFNIAKTRKRENEQNKNTNNNNVHGLQFEYDRVEQRGAELGRSGAQDGCCEDTTSCHTGPLQFGKLQCRNTKNNTQHCMCERGQIHHSYSRFLESVIQNVSCESTPYPEPICVGFTMSHPNLFLGTKLELVQCPSVVISRRFTRIQFLELHYDLDQTEIPSRAANKQTVRETFNVLLTGRTKCSEESRMEEACLELDPCRKHQLYPAQNLCYETLNGNMCCSCVLPTNVCQFAGDIIRTGSLETGLCCSTDYALHLQIQYTPSERLAGDNGNDNHSESSRKTNSTWDSRPPDSLDRKHAGTIVTSFDNSEFQDVSTKMNEEQLFTGDPIERLAFPSDVIANNLFTSDAPMDTNNLAVSGTYLETTETQFIDISPVISQDRTSSNPRHVGIKNIGMLTTCINVHLAVESSEEVVFSLVGTADISSILCELVFQRTCEHYLVEDFTWTRTPLHVSFQLVAQSAEEDVGTRLLWISVESFLNYYFLSHHLLHSQYEPFILTCRKSSLLDESREKITSYGHSSEQSDPTIQDCAWSERIHVVAESLTTLSVSHRRREKIGLEGNASLHHHQFPIRTVSVASHHSSSTSSLLTSILREIEESSSISEHSFSYPLGLDYSPKREANDENEHSCFAKALHNEWYSVVLDSQRSSEELLQVHTVILGYSTVSRSIMPILRSHTMCRLSYSTETIVDKHVCCVVHQNTLGYPWIKKSRFLKPMLKKLEACNPILWREPDLVRTVQPLFSVHAFNERVQTTRYHQRPNSQIELTFCGLIGLNGKKKHQRVHSLLDWYDVSNSLALIEDRHSVETLDFEQIFQSQCYLHVDNGDLNFHNGTTIAVGRAIMVFFKSACPHTSLSESSLSDWTTAKTCVDSEPIITCQSEITMPVNQVWPHEEHPLHAGKEAVGFSKVHPECVETSTAESQIGLLDPFGSGWSEGLTADSPHCLSSDNIISKQVTTSKMCWSTQANLKLFQSPIKSLIKTSFSRPVEGEVDAHSTFRPLQKTPSSNSTDKFGSGKTSRVSNSVADSHPNSSPRHSICSGIWNRSSSKTASSSHKAKAIDNTRVEKLQAVFSSQKPTVVESKHDTAKKDERVGKPIKPATREPRRFHKKALLPTLDIGKFITMERQKHYGHARQCPGTQTRQRRPVSVRPSLIQTPELPKRGRIINSVSPRKMRSLEKPHGTTKKLPVSPLLHKDRLQRCRTLK